MLFFFSSHAASDEKHFFFGFLFSLNSNLLGPGRTVHQLLQRAENIHQDVVLLSIEWHDSLVQGHILIMALYLIPGTQNMPLYLIHGLEKMQGHRTEQSTHCAF